MNGGDGRARADVEEGDAVEGGVEEAGGEGRGGGADCGDLWLRGEEEATGTRSARVNSTVCEKESADLALCVKSWLNAHSMSSRATSPSRVE